MRRLVLLSTAALALAAVGGCRSEEDTRAALRDNGINACVQGYQRSQNGGGDLVRSLDPRSICTCTIDRMMAGRSTDDLQTVVAQPATPEQRRMAQECLMAAVADQPDTNRAAPATNSSNTAAPANSSAPAPRPTPPPPTRPASERPATPTAPAPPPPTPAPTGNDATPAR